MSALPYMKFYCADWRADPRLRMCSLAARGLWIDLMTYMHEGEPYGHLTIDGKQPDLAGIAALVARPLKEVKAAIAELEVRNVFSRGDNGAIYSRRMVRDNAKAKKDRENGKGGGNPKLKPDDKPPDNGGVNPQDKAQIPESRNQKEELKRPDGRGDGYEFEGGIIRLSKKHFSEWTKAYPSIDLLAELTARDVWLGSERATDSDRKNWFISTSKYLANRNLEAKSRVVALKPEQRPGIPGIL